jgi:hypothetical protein
MKFLQLHLDPLLAVTTPTESILVTSSYVNVPPTETFPVTERVPPMLTFVLIATLLAFKFKLLGLVIVGVPEAPIRLTSFTPKPFSAI